MLPPSDSAQSGKNTYRGTSVDSQELLNFSQWVSCFTLNNSNDQYATYTAHKDGVVYDMALRCGEQSGTGVGWGYKHIRAGHESQWQNLYNSGVAKGWNPSSQGIEGWDDLMASAIGGATPYWSYASINTAAQKGCVLSRVAWLNVNTNKIVLTKKVVVVFSINNKRVITAYPVADNVSSCS